MQVSDAASIDDGHCHTPVWLHEKSDCRIQAHINKIYQRKPCMLNTYIFSNKWVRNTWTWKRKRTVFFSWYYSSSRFIPVLFLLRKEGSGKTKQHEFYHTHLSGGFIQCGAYVFIFFQTTGQISFINWQQRLFHCCLVVISSKMVRLSLQHVNANQK